MNITYSSTTINYYYYANISISEMITLNKKCYNEKFSNALSMSIANNSNNNYNNIVLNYTI